MVTLSPTVTLVELLWSIVWAITLGFNLWGLESALADLRAQRLSGKVNGRLTIAKQRVRHGGVRVHVSASFLIVGLISLSQPVVTIDPIIGAVNLAIFLSAAVVLAGDSILDRLDERRLLQGTEHSLSVAGQTADEAQVAANAAQHTADSAETTAVQASQTSDVAQEASDMVQRAADVLQATADEDDRKEARRG